MSVRVLVLAVLALLFVTPPVHGASIEDEQWHLGALDAYAAHEISRGDGVVVAVVDSGVDETVADLSGRLLPGRGFGSAAGTDGVRDTDGHGTSMATLIAGRGDGGALGIAPGAKILPVAAGTDGEDFPSDSVTESVRWAVDNGARVVNLSLGTPVESTPDLKGAVEYAFANDVVVVAATGNDGARHIGAPANVLGVLAVSGTVEGGAPWPSSNTGALTVLAAPAQDIVTASPLSVSESGYSQVSGTSAAAALVSGVAALVRAKYPDMSAADVVNRLVASATDIAGPGRDEATGFGLVNPVAALTATVPRVDRNPLLPGGVVVPGVPAAADPVDTGTLLALGAGVLLLAVVGGLVLLRRARARRGPRIEVVAGWEPPPPDDEFWRPKY
ncbi:S8 family serine peptidase [Umezawaea sp.]|uniref:S8 family serine peptidase n=1 Tax=Umezawaea sp. TaxID=1955258 RepID=UPI002ED24722